MTASKATCPTAWEEEIVEALASTRESLEDRRSDPDWRAASQFLARHCEKALRERLFRAGSDYCGSRLN